MEELFADLVEAEDAPILLTVTQDRTFVEQASAAYSEYLDVQYVEAVAAEVAVVFGVAA